MILKSTPFTTATTTRTKRPQSGLDLLQCAIKIEKKKIFEEEEEKKGPHTVL